MILGMYMYCMLDRTDPQLTSACIRICDVYQLMKYVLVRLVYIYILNCSSVVILVVSTILIFKRP